MTPLAVILVVDKIPNLMKFKATSMDTCARDHMPYAMLHSKMGGLPYRVYVTTRKGKGRALR